MRLEEASTPVFARHETFHLRYGWLKKAYDAVLADPQVFVSEHATVALGVGKNMVRAIRFWGRAARVLTNGPGSRSSAGLLPTRLGHAMFSDDGWDPYCEDPATLWLLHWWLLAPRNLLPVWWSAFNDFGALEFTDEQLSSFALGHLRGTPGWQTPHPSSIAKDISCLLRTYTLGSAGRSRATIDDSLDCPLRELGLIKIGSGNPRTYRFDSGGKPGLRPLIVLFASLDFVARTEGTGVRTVTVTRLTSETGGPGRAFYLSEHAFAERLEAAVLRVPSVRLAMPGGVVQLQFETDPARLANEVLQEHFASRAAGTISAASVAGPDAEKPLDLAAIGDVL